MRKYYPTLDMVRFILSILVVSIHTEIFSSFSLFANRLISHGYARLSVPLFFVISAYLLFSSGKVTWITIKEYSVRILKLYTFYFILFLPITLYIRFFSVMFDKGLAYAVFKFIESTLIGSSFLGSWYLNASVLGAIICFFIAKKSTTLLWIIGVLGQVLSVLTSNYNNFGYSESVHKIGTIFVPPYNSFCVAIIYFVIGKYLAEHDANEWWGQKFRMKGLIGSILFLTSEIIFTYYYDTGTATDSYIFLVPTTYFLFVNIIKIDIKQKGPWHYFRKLSTAIYVFHLEYVWIFGVLEKILDYQFNSLILFIMTTILSVASGSIIIWLSNKKHFGWLKVAT